MSHPDRSALLNVLLPPPISAQEAFDKKYITGAEIADRVGISRQAVSARMNRRFESIVVTTAYIWVRTPELEEFIDAWAITARR